MILAPTKPDDLTSQIAESDPNDLAIAYMAVLETGLPHSDRFLEAAEKKLTADFLDLQQPVLDRLYLDLVKQPIFPGRPPSNPLTRSLMVWARKGDVYRWWQKYQKTYQKADRITRGWLADGVADPFPTSYPRG